MASNFSVELLKVPFDNSYKKVFDINSVQNNSIDYREIFYDAVLSKQGDREQILSPAVSNIKRYNNRIIFTIRNNYFDTRKYNYIVLKYENTYFFYFIIDVISENDNPVNPSTTITGEWDIWHNNLNSIYKDRIINNNTIIRAHEDRFEYSNHTYFTTFYRNNNTKTFTEKVLNYDAEKNVYNDEYKMLWLRVTVADEFFTQYNDKLNGTFFRFGTDLTHCTGIRPITNSNFRNVLYIPISIYYKGESVGGLLRQKEIKDTTITPSHYITGLYLHDSGTGAPSKVYMPVSGSGIQLEKLPSINHGLNIMELYNENGITSYYKSVEYTFNAPYTIEFSKDNNNYYADIYAPFVRFNNILSGSSSYYGNAIIGMPDKFSDTLLTYTFYSIPQDITVNGDTLKQDFEKMKELFFDFENEKIINCLPAITPITDININDSIEKEPKLFIYPYKYYSLYYNNSEYILDIPQNKTQYLRYIIYTNKKTSQPFIRILSRTDVPSKTDIKQINNGNIYLKNSGEITYAIDALTDYQIRNGAQEKTSVYLNMLNNIIKNGFNVVGVGGAITSGINDLTRIASRYVDLNNTPDNVILSNRGEDDIYIQDNVLIYENTCSDNMLIQEKYKEFYIYGYDYVKIDNITNNSRFWFDYKQTQNCKLNNPINLTDKQRIEQMFDEGVHMFHINYDDKSGTYIVNTTMEFNGKNNIERSIATI